MENEKDLSSFSFAALFGVFILSGGIITAPDNKNSLIPFIIAAVLGVISAFIFLKLSERLFLLKSAVISGIIYAVVIAFSLAFALRAAQEFTGFIYEGVLVHENKFLIKLIFAACVFCLSLSDRKAIYKFSFLSAVLVTVIFVVLFFTSVKTFDIKNLKGAFSTDTINLKQIAYSYSRLFLSVFGAAAFGAKSAEKKGKGALAALGTLFGVLLCFVLVFDTVLSFGLPLASGLIYPYIDDISTVTVGSLFTRMDGFSYFAFFVCYLLRCAVFTRLSADLVEKSGIKKRKTATALLIIPLLF